MAECRHRVRRGDVPWEGRVAAALARAAWSLHGSPPCQGKGSRANSDDYACPTVHSGGRFAVVTCQNGVQLCGGFDANQ
jgi:hypothetical protein